MSYPSDVLITYMYTIMYFLFSHSTALLVFFQSHCPILHFPIVLITLQSHSETYTQQLNHIQTENTHTGSNSSVLDHEIISLSAYWPAAGTPRHIEADCRWLQIGETHSHVICQLNLPPLHPPQTLFYTSETARM